MPKTPDRPDGSPIWIDLSTTDVARSLEFYTEVFGWSHETSGAEFGNYVNFFHRGELVAGMVASDRSHPDAWTIYLKTSDATATADAVKANGGTVFLNENIPGLGTMVVLADASGVGVGAWQPGGHAGFGRINEPNTPVWHELHTTEFDRAAAFYERSFGWTLTAMPDEAGIRMSTFAEPGGEPIAGIFDATDQRGVNASHWLVYFGVADADDTVITITRLGGTQLTALSDTPFGRMCQIADPFGAVFAVVQVPDVPEQIEGGELT